MAQPDLSAFEFQYQRLLEAAECDTQAELSEVLGVKQSSISDAKSRQSIPATWQIKLFTEKSINPNWILYGEGGKFLVSTDAELPTPRVLRVTEVRPPRECSSRELFNELVRRALHEMDGKAI